MIDFRYHLVSIVAIFLALTVGIVLGSTVLEPTFFKSAEEMTASLRQANEKYLTQISELQTREEGGDSLVTTHLPDLVRGQLAGERVVLVEAPGASAALRDPIEKLVTSAGASYSGRVSLTDKFIDAEQASVIDGLATNLAPAGTTFPDGATPYDKAATMLAGAIVTNDHTQAGRANPAATGVLEAFQAGDFLTMNGNPEQRATLAIVLALPSRTKGRTPTGRRTRWSRSRPASTAALSARSLRAPSPPPPTAASSRRCTTPAAWPRRSPPSTPSISPRAVSWWSTLCGSNW